MFGIVEQFNGWAITNVVFNDGISTVLTITKPTIVENEEKFLTSLITLQHNSVVDTQNQAVFYSQEDALDGHLYITKLIEQSLRSSYATTSSDS